MKVLPFILLVVLGMPALGQQMTEKELLKAIAEVKAGRISGTLQEKVLADLELALKESRRAGKAIAVGPNTLEAVVDEIASEEIAGTQLQQQIQREKLIQRIKPKLRRYYTGLVRVDGVTAVGTDGAYITGDLIRKNGKALASIGRVDYSRKQAATLFKGDIIVAEGVLSVNLNQPSLPRLGYVYTNGIYVYFNSALSFTPLADADMEKGTD